MRILIFISILFIAATVNVDAQSFIPGSFIDNSYRGSLMNDSHVYDSAFKKKWFVSRYTGLSTSFSFFKGGSANVFSVPVALQLNHRLNNNLFAFAGISAASSYVNFRSSFLNADFSKTGRSNSFNQAGLGLYSRAELGLQYINDDRTFSISGSIGIERSDFQMPYSLNNNRINQTVPARRN